MKRILTLAIVALSAPFVFAACTGSSTKENVALESVKADSTKSLNKTVKYTCTMHPEVISDTPGSCPKCGMAMVIKEMNSNSDMQHMHLDSTKK